MSTGKVIMDLTPLMEKRLREYFNLEIEMLQGDREKLSNGNTRFTFEVKDPEKGRMIIQFLTMVPFVHSFN